MVDGRWGDTHMHSGQAHHDKVNRGLDYQPHYHNVGVRRCNNRSSVLRIDRQSDG